MPDNNILTINGGSSSIKFALFDAGEMPVLVWSGEVQRIGSSNTRLVFSPASSKQKEWINIEAGDFDSATNFLIEWFGKQNIFEQIKVIGHRVVHGMYHTEPEIITDGLLNELKSISAFDPDHLPGEIKLIETFKKELPGTVQIACFDTSFHTSMPPVAKLLPIPHKYFEKGIQRYGFHGLSYAYLLEELEHIAGLEVAQGKLIFAHLGNGASLAAVKDSKSIDTSMGFTPASGIPMSSRTGDLDPGVLVYLAKHEKLSAAQLNHLINHESGLLGISETSADMQDLLTSQYSDNRATEAVELFCYQTKKWIGSFAAALGGLDTLVFSGGIGEHSPEIRQRVCANLQFLGVELDEAKNNQNETVISSDVSKVTVWVIPTNEELMIAKLVSRIVNNT